MRNCRAMVVAILVVLVAGTAAADVRLPSVISNGMVLQRDTDVPVWGWADPGERVKVEVAGKSASTRADKKGRWSITEATMTFRSPEAPVSESL